MNFIILCFIILNLTKLVLNNSTDDSCNVCVLSYTRRKRAHTEYTRWRASAETTQEFIVKVLEDDLTPPPSNPIVAVNIQPLSTGRNKIVVDGAVLTTPVGKKKIDAVKNYHRFEPATTLLTTRANDNVNLPKPLVRTISPLRTIGVEIKVNEHQSQPYTYVAQYAPIVPVSFTRRSYAAAGAITPRTVDMHMSHPTTMRPTRTLHTDVIAPSRTALSASLVPKDYSFELHKILDLINNTSTSTFATVHETSSQIKKLKLDETSGKTFQELCDTQNMRRNDQEEKFNTDTNNKPSNLSYNDLIYSENDSYDINRKKVDSTSADYYYDYPQNVTETTLILRHENDNISTIKQLEASTIIFKVENITNTRSSTNLKEKPICSILKIRPLVFNSAQSLHEINIQLKKWADKSPITKILDITRGNLTTMENPIYMMVVNDPTSGQIVSAKLTVMIIAGIQGSDHHAVTAAMYLLYQLIERNEAHLDLLKKYRFWIIPVFNPDGYEYSMTFPHRRNWSKNLRQSWDPCKGRDLCVACEHFGIRCTVQPCYGVNLDRNFEYQWIPPEELRAEHPCGGLYAGPYQLSEAETGALTQFLHDLPTPLYTFIAFKEGDVLGILYPYSHTRKRRALDHIYRRRALRAASAAYSISGRPYVAGQTSEFLPLYAGGIEDWVDGHLGIENSYTVMMFRPTDVRDSKVVTERVVHEAFAAVDTLLFQSVEAIEPPQVTLTRAGTLLSRVNIKLLIYSYLVVIHVSYC